MNYELSYYLNGLSNMASSLSSKIGPSFVECYCIYKDEFKKELFNNFKIKDYILEKVNDLEELTYYLDDKIIDNMFYWINLKLGNILNYYQINCNYDDVKNTLFYIVDDMIVVEYKEYMVLFIVGNNE